MRITAAAIPRLMRVEMAAPAPPQRQTKIKRAFPPTFRIFIMRETHIPIRLFPMLRKRAEPAVLRAIKGKLRAEKKRYTSALAMIPGAI
jgi:hypothetical protein